MYNFDAHVNRDYIYLFANQIYVYHLDSRANRIYVCDFFNSRVNRTRVYIFDSRVNRTDVKLFDSRAKRTVYLYIINKKYIIRD